MQADDLSTLEDDTRPPNESREDANAIGAMDIAKDLVKRCHELLNELEAFHTFIKICNREHTVELKPFVNTVTSELRSLEKVSYYLVPSIFTYLHGFTMLLAFFPLFTDRSLSFALQIPNQRKYCTLFDRPTYHSTPRFGMLQRLRLVLSHSPKGSTGTHYPPEATS